MAKAEIEYEITPAMIEAGVAELGRYDSRFGYPINPVVGPDAKNLVTGALDGKYFKTSKR